MPVFILTPKNLESEKWKHTRHKGLCLIVTDNERSARSIVSTKFVPLLGRARQYPWSDEELASVEIVSVDPRKYRRGEVYVRDQDGEFMRFPDESETDLAQAESGSFSDAAFSGDAFSNDSFDSAAPNLGEAAKREAPVVAGTPLSDARYNIEPLAGSDAQYGITPGANRAAGGVTMSGSASEFVAVTGSGALQAGPAAIVGQGKGEVGNPPIVRRVLQNRQLIALHTTGLLGLLDDFCKAGDGNIQRPQFWLDDDPSSDQLRALLADLRDELRLLNDLLSRPRPDNAILQKVLGVIGTAGTTYLNEAAKSLGKWTGTGVFFSVVLGRFLVDVDAMSVDALCKVIAKMPGE